MIDPKHCEKCWIDEALKYGVITYCEWEDRWTRWVVASKHPKVTNKPKLPTAHFVTKGVKSYGRSS